MTTPQAHPPPDAPPPDLTPVQMTMDQLETLLQQLYHPPPPNNPKVEDPELYYGERSKLRAFITQCELKFNCEPNKFNEDIKNISYTSSRCRGNAWAWIEPSIKAGKSTYTKWEEFKTAMSYPTFKTHFKNGDSYQVMTQARRQEPLLTTLHPLPAGSRIMGGQGKSQRHLGRGNPGQPPRLDCF
jgi:hypothetical protein